MTPISFHCSHLTGVFIVLIYSAALLLCTHAGLGGGGLREPASAYPQVQPRGTQEKYAGTSCLTAVSYLEVAVHGEVNEQDCLIIQLLYLYPH